MKEDEARRLGLDLMKGAEAAYLTTVDRGGFPNTRAMFNLRRIEQFPALASVFKEHSEDFLVYFTTNASSAKIRHIENNPKVCVYYCKPSEWRGLLLGGEIEVIKERGIKKSIWQKGWELYYPGGPDDPDHMVLRLYPVFATYYHQLDGARFSFGSPRA